MDPIDRMNLNDPISPEERARIRSQPWYSAFLQYEMQEREMRLLDMEHMGKRLIEAREELRKFYGEDK